LLPGSTLSIFMILSPGCAGIRLLTVDPGHFLAEMPVRRMRRTLPVFGPILHRARESVGTAAHKGSAMLLAAALPGLGDAGG
jgi:hypothetical protein